MTMRWRTTGRMAPAAAVLAVLTVLAVGTLLGAPPGAAATRDPAVPRVRAEEPVVATIPVGSSPRSIAVGLGGTRLYVANQVASTVTVVDTGTNAVVATVPVGQAPADLAVDAAGTHVYVANTFSDSLSVIDAATNAVTRTIPVGDGPVSVALDPTGARAFVSVYNQVAQPDGAGSSTGWVQTVDIASGTVVATAETGVSPGQVAVSPIAPRAYVTSNRRLTTIDTATGARLAQVEHSWMSGEAITTSPDGAQLLVTDPEAWLLHVLDAATGAAVSTVDLLQSATGVVATPTRTYLATQGIGEDATQGAITVLNPATNKLMGTLPVGGLPGALALSPDGTRLYSADVVAGTVTVSDVTRTFATKPRSVSAWRSAPSRATVRWRPPRSDGGSPITGYVVTSYPEGYGCTATAARRSCRVRGLNPDERHQFFVQARTAAGLGARARSAVISVR